jgi:hypothetical protein
MPITKDELKKRLDKAFGRISAGEYSGAVYLADHGFCTALAEILADLTNRTERLERDLDDKPKFPTTQ